MEWPLFVYDFDFPQSWTPRFQDLLKPGARQIVHEVERQIEWERSGSDVRMLAPEPPAPVKDAVLHKICDDFSRNSFRAFHATRLVRPEVVLEEGLRALNRRDQIDLVQRTYQGVQGNQQVDRRVKCWTDWEEDTDTLQTHHREGDCWLVPSRHMLHDGGLDCMFERIGGEFIQRVSGDPFRDSSDKNLDPGRATVVVAILPSRWCWRAPEAGPMKILCETMASLGHPLHESLAPYWDVKVGADIPPENIECVCDRTDERVAAPPVPDGSSS